MNETLEIYLEERSECSLVFSYFVRFLHYLLLLLALFYNKFYYIII